MESKVNIYTQAKVVQYACSPQPLRNNFGVVNYEQRILLQMYKLKVMFT